MSGLIQDILKRLGAVEITLRNEPKVATPKFDGLRKLGKAVMKEDKDNNTLNDKAEKAYKAWKKKGSDFNTYLSTLDNMFSNALRIGDSMKSGCDKELARMSSTMGNMHKLNQQFAKESDEKKKQKIAKQIASLANDVQASMTSVSNLLQSAQMQYDIVEKGCNNFKFPK